jgi:ribosome-associated toxin RatA of RatAB toxin-antitoxin module
MTRLEHGVLIRRPLAEVYALCRQVERYPEFLPDYRESKILSQIGDAFLLERAAVMKGQLYRWKSWARFKENQSIHFEHVEGPLRGMQVDWHFYPVHRVSTQVVIIHQFQIQRPWGVGFFLEQFVFKPRLNGIAGQVVAALKEVCEAQKPEVVLL